MATDYADEQPLSCPICCMIHIAPNVFIAVDPEDWVDLHRFKWRIKKARGGSYAYRKVFINGRSKRVYMHREIMKTLPGYQCHHKYNNPLDNRKACLENLTEDQHRIKTQFNRISKKRFKTRQIGFSALPMKNR